MEIIRQIILKTSFWLLFLIVPGLNPVLDKLEIFEFIQIYSYRLGVVLFALVLFLDRKGIKSNWFLLCYAVLFLFMVWNGLSLKVNNIEAIFQVDFWPHLLFGLLALSGYNHFYFAEFERILLQVLLIGVILNVIGIIIEPTFLRRLTSGRSLAYLWQVMLTPSIWFLFRLEDLSKFNRRLVIVSFAILFLEQILFQKRLPLARMAFILIFLSYCYSFYRIYGRKLKKVIKSYILYGYISLTFLGLGLLFGLGIDTYVQATIDRFYQSGDLKETVLNDTRWTIGQKFIDDLIEKRDLILGRGFGGVVFGLGMNKAKTGVNFRTSAEMGVSTILLKGGIILLLFWAFVTFSFILRINLAKKSRVTFSFWFVVFLFFLFLYVEGYFGAEQNVFHHIVAYGLGYTIRLR